MTVVYDRFGVTVHAGDCLEVLAGLPDASVHAVVTDPPYGIRFMGKAWDGEDIEAGVSLRRSQAPMPDDGKAGANGGYRSAAAEAGRYDLSANAAFGEWCRQWSTECLRVLKPGGHFVSFGGSRTWHRLAAAVEDAGFEIRDSIAWLYATGFPKSLDVSKAIDKAVGAEREVIGPNRHSSPNRMPGVMGMSGANRRPSMEAAYAAAGLDRAPETAPATADAARWAGWGTALKPAFEPIVVARKPLEGTVAGNVLKHDTGALNIDGCRIGTNKAVPTSPRRAQQGPAYGDLSNDPGTGIGWDPNTGRWPTNVVLTQAATPDGVDLCVDGCVPGCVVAELDEQSGIRKAGSPKTGAEPQAAAYSGEVYGAAARLGVAFDGYGDTGGASRFFPVFRFEAKAPAAERPRVDGVAHPTVKPLALMRWLVRLVTPPGGTVLDPFLGSGTTAQAARAEGFQCVGIEREESYLPLIRERLDGGPGDLFGGVA